MVAPGCGNVLVCQALALAAARLELWVGVSCARAQQVQQQARMGRVQARMAVTKARCMSARL